MKIKINPAKFGLGKVALVVDDNPAIRKALTSAFLSNGYKTCGEAENGKEGLELAVQINPDIIVMDLSMPVMNGLEASSRIRKILPNVPIILFTLYGDSIPQSEVKKAGLSSVLLKTTPLSTVLDKAHELIERHS